MKTNTFIKLMAFLVTVFSCQYAPAETDVHYAVTPIISSQLELKILEALEDGDDYIFTLQYANIACINETSGCLNVKFMNVVLQHGNQLVLSTPSAAFKINEKLSFSNFKVNEKHIDNITLELGYGNNTSPIPSKVFSIKLNSRVLNYKG